MPPILLASSLRLLHWFPSLELPTPAYLAFSDCICPSRTCPPEFAWILPRLERFLGPHSSRYPILPSFQMHRTAVLRAAFLHQEPQDCLWMDRRECWKCKLLGHADLLLRDSGWGPQHVLLAKTVPAPTSQGCGEDCTR